VVLLVGATEKELGGSEYARTLLGRVAGKPPALDLEREAAAGGVIRNAISQSLLASVHDLSEGGLAVALAEACIDAGLGAKVDLPESPSPFASLFSETSSRYLISIAEKNLGAFHALANAAGVAAFNLGCVGGSSLTIGGMVQIPVADLQYAHTQSFAAAIDPALG
jgi:phosphoribosylformylglycinamidine (FGAM) synthase-like enzyme